MWYKCGTTRNKKDKGNIPLVFVADLFHSMGHLTALCLSDLTETMSAFSILRSVAVAVTPSQRCTVLSVVCRHTFVFRICYYPLGHSAENGLYTPLTDASALLCTDPLYFGEIGKSRANRTPISSFGDYRSTIELCSHIVEITDKR